MRPQVDLLVRGGDVVTMDADRRMVADGAVAVSGELIVAVGDVGRRCARRTPTAAVIGDADALVTPGYVNAHQHLTGDRLVHSCIPDAIDSQEAIFGWAVPVHARTPATTTSCRPRWPRSRRSPTASPARSRPAPSPIPDRVAAAVRAVGMRATIGQWGWDVDGVPFGAPAAEVLQRHARAARPLPPPAVWWRAG